MTKKLIYIVETFIAQDNSIFRENIYLIDNQKYELEHSGIYDTLEELMKVHGIEKSNLKNALKYQFLSFDKAKTLENMTAFLSELTPSNDVIHVITYDNDMENWDIEKTNLLHELQILNKRRKEILNQFQ